MTRLSVAEYKALTAKTRRGSPSPAGSHLEDLFLHQLKTHQLPQPEREYRFHTIRRWRFDFAWPERRLAVEIEGGTWIKSRHTTGTGFHNDCEKYNAAALLGWTVLRFDGAMVRSGQALTVVREALELMVCRAVCRP